jgi:regulator of protease activity HflC (stomatin/prohibitin superfamily)
MGGFEWISQLVDWVSRFFPRYVILDTTLGAVKFKGGKNPVALGPGVHWYWPFRTVLKEVPTARQCDDLRTQTIVTKDGRIVTVGGMIISEVFDVIKLAANCYDGPLTIQDITLTVIHDVCCNLDWAKLLEKQQKGTLDTELRNAARKQLEEYGVRPIKVMLTDLAPARVLRLVQSNQAG